MHEMLICYIFTLAVAPMFLTPLKNLTVVTPEDATFFCEATARPGPTVTWGRVETDGNLTQLMNGTDYTIEDGATGERIRNSTLIVKEAEPSDAGTYVCVAMNIVDSIEAFIILNVYGELDIGSACIRYYVQILHLHDYQNILLVSNSTNLTF